MPGPHHHLARIALLTLLVGGVNATSLCADDTTPARADTPSTQTESDPLRDLARRFADRDDTPEQPNRPESPTRSDAAPPRDTASNADQPLGQPADDTDTDKGDWLLGQRDNNERANDTDNDDNNKLTTGTSGILQTLMALGGVIALILLLRWAWLRLSGQPGAAASTPVVEVLSRTTVAPRNHVLLLRVGHRILIVGDSSSGMRTLASVDDEQEVADLLTAINANKDNSISRNFQQLLGRFGATHDETMWNGEEDGRDDAEHVLDRAHYNVSGLTSRIRTLTGRKGGNP